MPNSDKPPVVNTPKYYFYDDNTKVVYYTDNMIDDVTLIYVGSSDNPKPMMATAAFLEQGKIKSGFRLREYKE